MFMNDSVWSCPQCHKAESNVAKKGDFCPECRFPIMIVAGKYRLTKVISKGGFGVVYKAKHIALDDATERAIKFIDLETSSVEVEERFRREIQITSKLSEKNPHIIRVYDDFGEISHLGHYYVMEYLDGVSVRDWLHQSKSLPSLEECYQLFLQLCAALRTVHKADVIHRDLKPSNLMLIEKNDAPLFLKVLDFGIARSTPTGNTAEPLTKNVLGTPLYMSPEQCVNGRVDVRSDIYAMGLILYEMIAGRSPFFDEENSISLEELVFAQIQKSPPKLSIVAPYDRSFPPALEEVVAKALEKVPGLRYASVDEFEAAFLDVFGGSLSAPSTSSPLLQSSVQSPSEPKQAASLLFSTGETSPEEEGMAVSLLSPKYSLAKTLQPSLPSTSQAELESVSLAPAFSFQTRPKFLLGVVSFLLFVGCGAMLGPLSLWRSEPNPKSSVRQKIPVQRRTLDRPVHPKSLKSLAKKILRPRPEAKPTSHIDTKAKPLVIPSIPIRGRRRIKKRFKARRKRWLRYVKGCPRSALFWTRFSLPKSQRDKVKLRFSQGQLVKKKDGFCFGVRSQKTRLQFGHSLGGYVPCSLYPAKLLAKVRIVLLEEGLMEPDSVKYCLQR